MPSSFEFDGVRKDGSIVPLQGFARRVVWEGEEAAQRTFIDITERRRAEDALRESEERYRKLVEVSLDAIFVRQGELYVYANAAASKLFKVSSPDEIVGRNWLVNAPPAERNNAWQNYLRVSQHEQTQPNTERRFVRLDGSEVEVEASATPIDWNRQAAVLSVVRDITKRKNAERKLAAAQAELVRSERLATLGQLTATVSHELRNPLGAMRTSIYMLRNHMPSSDARLMRAAERIDRNITRCDGIIDELLDFTRIRDLEIEPAILDNWLGLVLDEQAVPDGVEVRRAPGAPQFVVAFDADRLRRAVVNVYDNACQAMAGPGARSRGGGEKVLTVATRAIRDRVEISFRDTGPGIPADLRDKIFEPLFSTKGFGVGLGLSVVRHILERHGGGIEIASRDGGGAEVVLWLPQRQYRDAAE